MGREGVLAERQRHRLRHKALRQQPRADRHRAALRRELRVAACHRHAQPQLFFVIISGQLAILRERKGLRHCADAPIRGLIENPNFRTALEHGLAADDAPLGDFRDCAHAEDCLRRGLTGRQRQLIAHEEALFRRLRRERQGIVPAAQLKLRRRLLQQRQLDPVCGKTHDLRADLRTEEDLSRVDEPRVRREDAAVHQNLRVLLCCRMLEAQREGEPRRQRPRRAVCLRQIDRPGLYAAGKFNRAAAAFTAPHDRLRSAVDHTRRVRRGVRNDDFQRLLLTADALYALPQIVCGSGFKLKLHCRSLLVTCYGIYMRQGTRL